MIQLTVDAGLRDRLLDMNGPVALCDDSGRVFGRFTPDVTERVEPEPSVAGFFEPMTFTWTSSAHRLRQAARDFADQTDANS